MNVQNLADSIKLIRKSADQYECARLSTFFYKSLLQTIEEIFTNGKNNDLVSLFERIADRQQVFPFLLQHGLGYSLRNLGVLQDILTKIKNALLSFIKNKFMKTDIHAAVIRRFLSFSDMFDAASGELFMTVLPAYIAENGRNLSSSGLMNGLNEMLFVSNEEISEHIGKTDTVRNEYRDDFLSLNDHYIYPVDDVIYSHAQAVVLEEKYLRMYGLVSLMKKSDLSSSLEYAAFPPYLFPLFSDDRTRAADFSGLVKFLAMLNIKAGNEGLLSLEDDIEELADSPVLKDGLQLIIDGMDHTLAGSMIDSRIESSLYFYHMRLKLISRGLLSIYMSDSPRVTEEIVRAIAAGIHTDEFENLINDIVRYSHAAHREGILCIEEMYEDRGDILLGQGIRLISSGAEYDFIRLMFDMISERLMEEKTLYFSVVKSGIMHIAGSTHSLAMEKYLQHMVPFMRRNDIKHQKEKYESLMRSVIDRMGNKCDITDMKYKNFHRLMTLLIEQKAGLIGMYSYFSSFLQTWKDVPFLEIFNDIYRKNSEHAAFLAEETMSGMKDNPDTAVTFLLPLAYKNNLLIKFYEEEKKHLSHNAVLAEKIRDLEQQCKSMLTQTMINLKKNEAEKNPNIENLSYLCDEQKIIDFLKGLGELHRQHQEKYRTFFSELKNDAVKGITGLSKDIFSFIPDISGIKESPFLPLDFMASIISKNDSLLKKIDSIFPDDQSHANGSSLGASIRNHLLSFHDLVAVSDNSLKEILSHITTEELFAALKTGDSAIRDKFYNNLDKSGFLELKELMDSEKVPSDEEVRQARDKIIHYVFRLDEIVSLIAFRSMMRKNQ